MHPSPSGPVVGAPSSGLQPVSVPPPTPDGPPKDVKTLVDRNGFKLVAITLRQGFGLPAHLAPVPITIQAVHGRARVDAAGQSIELGPGGVVVLAPMTTHSVVPIGDAPVTLLVHRNEAAAVRT